MQTLTFRLGWPPSVNHYYGRSRRTGHVFLKEAGRMYRRQAAVEFARLGWPRLAGPVDVSLFLFPPDCRKRDIDNVRKAVYDALSDRQEHTGVIADDSLIKSDRAEFVAHGDGDGEGWIEITISTRRE